MIHTFSLFLLIFSPLLFLAPSLSFTHIFFPTVTLCFLLTFLFSSLFLIQISLLNPMVFSTFLGFFFLDSLSSPFVPSHEQIQTLQPALTSPCHILLDQNLPPMGVIVDRGSQRQIVAKTFRGKVEEEISLKFGTHEFRMTTTSLRKQRC